MAIIVTYRFKIKKGFAFHYNLKKAFQCISVFIMKTPLHNEQLEPWQNLNPVNKLGSRFGYCCCRGCREESSQCAYQWASTGAGASGDAFTVQMLSFESHFKQSLSIYSHSRFMSFDKKNTTSLAGSC